MILSDFNYRYVLEKFLADHTREKPHYVDIKIICTKFKPCDMLYRYLNMLEFEKYIYRRMDDDNILGVWGYDSLFEMIDNSPYTYREVKTIKTNICGELLWRKGTQCLHVYMNGKHCVMKGPVGAMGVIGCGRDSVRNAAQKRT